MRRLAILAAGAAVLSAASAHASGIPAVTFPPTQYSESVGSQFNLGAGTVEFAGNRASAGFAGTPRVSVGGDGATATANATAEWGFFVEGPATPTVVPILITGSYSLDTTGAGFAFANLFSGAHNISFSDLLHVECSSGVGDCSSTNFTLHTVVQANVFQDIEIQAGGLGHGVSTFDAVMDPMISFDLSSGFDFSGLTLDVTPDALPTSGAPEPADWMLMILGFGGLGALARRRRESLAA